MGMINVRWTPTTHRVSPMCWYCGTDALSQRVRGFPKTLTCDKCGATTVPQLQVDMGAGYNRIRARLRRGMGSAFFTYVLTTGSGY